MDRTPYRVLAGSVLSLVGRVRGQPSYGQQWLTTDAAALLSGRGARAHCALSLSIERLRYSVHKIDQVAN
jgi:hypothetical protein